MCGGWVGRPHSHPAPPIHVLEPGRVNVAQAGGGQIEMPATAAGVNYWPRALEACSSRMLLSGNL
jgi:hypothetical protein